MVFATVAHSAPSLGTLETWSTLNRRAGEHCARQSLNLAVGDSVFGHDEPALPAAAAAAAEAGASAAESSGRLEAERERVEKYKEVRVRIVRPFHFTQTVRRDS